MVLSSKENHRDTLRAFVNGRGDDWDRCLPLVDFAINNSESAVAAGMTPFFIDRGEHPRLPLSHGPTEPAESGAAPRGCATSPSR